ncbi:hypothetical protein BDV26DRAFT_260563 [Aspergillus bertholletiae]|uniref:Uncharacterized protein n=1 Tax=Aspergillus bertholletiae TaxID=1226010 RepID=A0A5N7BB85_9EURO|nr:hypothetical protein BDV26DRAFT_260563 [Aspergillus bertholletiae]
MACIGFVFLVLPAILGFLGFLGFFFRCFILLGGLFPCELFFWEGGVVSNVVVLFLV